MKYVLTETDGGYGDLGTIPSAPNPAIKKKRKDREEDAVEACKKGKAKFKLKNEANKTSLKVGDNVENYGMAGVVRKITNGGKKVVVYFKETDEEIQFDYDELEEAFDTIDEIKGNRDAKDKKIAKFTAKARQKAVKKCSDSQSPHKVDNGGGKVRFVCKKKDKDKARKASKRMKKFNKTSKGKKSKKVAQATKSFRK